MIEWFGTVVAEYGSVNITIGMIAMVSALVFFASCVDAIAGGGGLISLPAYLLTGLPPVVASASNKFSACFGTMMAAGRFLKSRKMLVVPGLLAVCGALPGSFVGAELLKRMPEQFVRTFMLVMIPVVAVTVFVKRDAKVVHREIKGKWLLVCFAIGLGCGFYDGFFGPGTGTFLILLFTYIVGMDMVTASGTAKLVNLASNLAALTSFVLSGHVAYIIAIPAMICSLAGGYTGAKLAISGGAKTVRAVMFGVLGLLIVTLIWQTVG